MKKQVNKVAFLGDGAVGKSSLIKARSDGGFNSDSKITIGVDIQCIPFKLTEENDDKENIHLMAVDLGGQSRFHFIHDAYINGIKAAMIIYDLNRFKSFMNLPRWFKLIEDENPTVPIFLVGNKSDLINEKKKQFYTDQWEEIKTSIPNASNVIEHAFVSSKEMTGVGALFQNCEKVLSQ